MPKAWSSKSWLGFIFAAAWLLSSASSAEVRLSGRHIYILYPGLDSVWGSYLFIVENNAKQAERFSFPVMLPSETIDFQGQDSLGPDELKLGADGGLIIDKVFEPGENLVNIGFKMPAKEGRGTVKLKPHFPTETLGLFVFEGQFDVSGPGLDVRRGIDFSGRKYDTYTLAQTVPGQLYQFDLSGIPEGRSRLWIIGGLFAALLLLVGLGVAFLSRPKITQGADDSL